jgi:glucose/arabinose dehydrogenase
MMVSSKRQHMVRWVLFALSILLLTTLLPVAAQEDNEEYQVGVQLVAQGLTAPVAMAYPDDGSGRLFVVDQAGTIRIIDANGQLLPDPFLDLSGQIVPLKTDYDERGVLGLAFHPDYAKNGRFFVYYSIPLRAGAPAGWDHTNVVGELNVSADDPNKADLGTLKTVLQIDQPQLNHNSGHITFGPDGYLYIPIGDGGGANDTDMGHTPTLGNGQDVSEVHGSILRIDVNGTPGDYTIPADNPFAGQPGKAQEIFAYGFRNPYHISFDMGGNHDLYAADAGQDLYEEVDEVTNGGNYGWNIKEGTHCFNPQDSKNPPAQCASTGADGEALIDPVIEYSHEEVGEVVIGGYIYRGTALSDLEGDYLFGDYTSSEDGTPDGTLLWAEPADTGLWKWGKLKVAGMPNDRIGANVLGIGQGSDGELYVMTSQTSAPTGDTGKVWKLVPAQNGASSTEEATSEAGSAAATSEAGSAGATSEANTSGSSAATSVPPQAPNATAESSG